MGLVPQSKLLELLTIAISRDAIETIRYTREVIVTGVEPQVIVSQLASLITYILSSMGSSKDNRLSRSRSQLSKILQLTTYVTFLLLVDTREYICSEYSIREIVPCPKETS